MSKADKGGRVYKGLGCDTFQALGAVMGKAWVLWKHGGLGGDTESLSWGEPWSGMEVTSKEAETGHVRREGSWEVCGPPKVVLKAGAPCEEEGGQGEGRDTLAGEWQA